MEKDELNKDIFINENINALDSKEAMTMSLKSVITKDIKKSKSNKEKNLKKICIICGSKGTEGILILDKKICSECEKQAITADINSEFYENYKEKILKNVVGKLKKLG